MLEVLRHIIWEVNSATNLDEAVGIIVRRVKQAMGVDVCSIYLNDKVHSEYVLLASDGLDESAVGRVRLRHDEGLVGLVGKRKEPVIVRHAAKHPNYRYIPETGEERYRAFVGVPIVHYRQVSGVLVIQRKEDSRFNEDEVAFLVTIAAQLAGAINHAALDGSISGLLNRQAQECQIVQGLPGSPGVAIGTIVVVYPLASIEAVPDRQAKDIHLEQEAFKAAVAQIQEELRLGSERLAHVLPAEERALFEAYVMLSSSDTLMTDTLTLIQEGNWAPAALRKTIAKHVKVFEEMEDPYLRARANDIRDIGTQILIRLQSETRSKIEYPERSVLLGNYVSVMQVSEVPNECLAGIVCTEGSSLSHIAILARALGVPAIMGLGDLPFARLDGREIIVDGYQGEICIQPTETMKAEYQRLINEEDELSSGLQGLRELPAQTTDGKRVGLHVNIGLLTDLPTALSSGAEGVGLYRTEFAFMIRNTFSPEETQYRMYRRVLMVFAPKPVNIRVLDIGGDKVLPYFHTSEQNPALGWRGIRVLLDHPEIFITQLRALLRANAGLHNLRVLLPLITSVSEVSESVELLEATYHELLLEGYDCAKPQIAVMIETPAAVHQIAALAKSAEFFSIGTNDLTQHILAVDRNNPRVANLYDHLHPAVLQAIKQVIETAHQWGRPVSVCGEMAGDPAATTLLLAMGVDHLSMAASNVPRIKQVIRSFSLSRCLQLLHQALEVSDVKETRTLLAETLNQAGLGGLLRAGK